MTFATQDPLLARLEATTSAFRIGLEGQGNEQLTALIDAIGQRLPLLPAERLPRLTPLLENALNAIARRDYLWAADMLDYEIRPLVSSSEEPPC